MVDLLKLMERELSSQSDSEELITITQNIFHWYDEGGPSIIKDNLLKYLKEANSTVSKNIKGITPEVKKSKKKIKKRKK